MYIFERSVHKNEQQKQRTVFYFEVEIRFQVLEDKIALRLRCRVSVFARAKTVARLGTIPPCAGRLGAIHGVETVRGACSSVGGNGLQRYMLV